VSARVVTGKVKKLELNLVLPPVVIVRSLVELGYDHYHYDMVVVTEYVATVLSDSTAWSLNA